MKVDLSLVLSIGALMLAIFGALAVYLSSIRLKGTVYDAERHRVDLDRTRLALETDFRRMYDEIYRDRGRWEEINHLVLDMAEKAKFHTAAEQSHDPIDPRRFLDSFGIDPKTIDVVARQVFVLTPLSEKELPTYQTVETACEKVGLFAVRGDEQNIVGPILPVVVREIIRSRFVIADLNGRNPNVFYEMGIAQALGKDVLMFAERGDITDIPFDLAHQRIIFYESRKQLHDRLVSAIAQLGWGIERSLRPS
ncbi:hypothetical protein [Sphingomonas sp. URHD0057]|uniref:hypothetical protein n=1 Tax=Sphingomonas sp. URHD0057 TaxID=1380389 RepID=UPI000684FA2E|nr:hypothetical protein [Sphingomonas sp. URHD0057]